MTHGQFGRIAIISACKQDKLVVKRTMVQRMTWVSTFDPLRALSEVRSLSTTDGAQK